MPSSSLPYGEAPGWCFPAVEISMYLLLALCLFHAAKKNAEAISYLIAGVLFGLLLEYVDVNSHLGYTYGKFSIMFGKSALAIPLCIGVGWGIIMCTARLFTDTINLPLWAIASLDALLALNIDISMDAVAYRLHMWTWNWSSTGFNPATAHWFGVPYANFYGWLFVVFFYSLFSRLLENKLFKGKQITKVTLAFVPLFSVLLSQAALWITIVEIRNFLHHHSITDGSILLFTLSLFVLIMAVNWKQKKSSFFHQPPMPGWCRFGFMSFSLSCFLQAAFIKKQFGLR